MEKTLELQLNDLLQKILTEKTLSVEAMDVVKNLSKEHKELKELVELKQELIKNRDEEIGVLKEENTKLKNSIDSWLQKESNLVDREKAVTDIEHQKELLNKDITHQKERSDEMKEVFGIVFKNTITRKKVQGQVPVAVPGFKGNYGSDTQPYVTQSSSMEEVIESEE